MSVMETRQAATAAEAVDGDSAFGSFYDATSMTAYSLALRITRDARSAETVCEDAYVEYWRGRTAGAAERFPQCQSRLLGMVRQHAVKLRPEREGKVEWPRSASASTAYTSAGTVRAALDGLGNHERSALELVYFGGLGVSEVAEQLKATVHEVRGFLRSALLTLANEVHA